MRELLADAGAIDGYIGDRFRKMTITGPVVSKNGRKWPVRCKCGSMERLVNVNQLARWRREGTGCRECMNRLKHGHGSTKNRTYGSWYSMKARCYNESSISYKYYGGKGVTVCERWLESFSNFLEDMGERPPGKTLDRKNPFGVYEKSNCRWSTPKEQAENKRSTYKGEDQK